MKDLKVGDIVARKSYGFDILFKVTDIRNNGKEDVFILKGIAYRIQADAPECDLELQPECRINEHIMGVLKKADDRKESTNKSCIGK